MADFALDFFIKDAYNLLKFPENLESTHFDLCSLRYCQFTQRCSSCIFAVFCSCFEWHMISEFNDQGQFGKLDLSNLIF